MSRPYSLIQRADELKAAKDEYDKWLALSKADKSTAYQQQQAQTGNLRSDVGKVVGYLIPFGVDKTKSIYALTKLLAPGNGPTAGEEEAATALITDLTTAVIGAALYSVTVAPSTAGDIVVKIAAGQLARVTLREKEGASRRLVSRVTKAPYSYTKTNAVSTPIGQGLGANSDTDYEAVKASLRGNTTLVPVGGVRSLAFRAQKDISISVAS